jgi:hypothetical protein
MSSSMNLFRYELGQGLREVIEKSLDERVFNTSLDPDAQTAILAGVGAHVLRTYLPGEILHALSVFPSTGYHALVLDNLPQQDFPATPVQGFTDETRLAVINAVHLGLLQLIGNGLTPYAVDYENDGRLIRNVVPNPAASGTTSSWGADTEFFWHTDNPHLPFARQGTDPRPSVPRYLTFYAVRNEERVPTEVLDVEASLARLDAETLAVLRSPSFDIAAPDSNDVGDGGERMALRAAPLVQSVSIGNWVRYDQGTTSATTPQAEKALSTWVDAMTACEGWEPVLTPGQFLIFDNYRVLHRRKAFTPGPADSARWLRRCYAS